MVTLNKDVDSRVNKDENVHRYAVRGGKDREIDREEKREREKESVCERERNRQRKERNMKTLK